MLVLCCFESDTFFNKATEPKDYKYYSKNISFYCKSDFLNHWVDELTFQFICHLIKP